MSVILAPGIDQRMQIHAIDTERVWSVWYWCSDAYLQHGMKLTMPEKTDPTKTYQWRFASALAKKFDEWKFDEPTSKKFISIAAKHAKEVGMMKKGLAAFHQGNMLNICHERLMREISSGAEKADLLTSVKDWLMWKAGDKPLLTALLYRLKPTSHCNLTMWYQASKITPLYMSLSQACGDALKRIELDSPSERAILPKPTTLYLVRFEFLQEPKNLVAAQNSLGQDWRKQCR